MYKPKRQIVYQALKRSDSSATTVDQHEDIVRAYHYFWLSVVILVCLFFANYHIRYVRYYCQDGGGDED